MKRPEAVHNFSWGKSGPSSLKQKKSSNCQTSARMDEDSSGQVVGVGISVASTSHNCGEITGEVVGDGIGVATTSNNCREEVKFKEESRDDCDEEFRDANAPDDHNGEVNSGDITESNKGVCDGEVVVGSGESNREFVGDGIGGATTTSDSCGEVECGEELREDCADSTNGSNDNHGEVDVGDTNENKKKYMTEKLLLIKEI